MIFTSKPWKQISFKQLLHNHLTFLNPWKISSIDSYCSIVIVVLFSLFLNSRKTWNNRNFSQRRFCWNVENLFLFTENWSLKTFSIINKINNYCIYDICTIVWCIYITTTVKFLRKDLFILKSVLGFRYCHRYLVLRWRHRRSFNYYSRFRYTSLSWLWRVA